MAISKITSSDLANVGVIGLPDTPGLSASQMQIKFEETVRTVAIPKINEIIDDMVDKEYVDEKIIEIGAGDMAKGIYDTNNNGKVDNAEHSDLATRRTVADLADSCTLAINSSKWGGYTIAIVNALPSVPDSNTIYFVKG